MKRVVLLGVVALLLAASVFAPTASAQQQLGDVRVESATLQSDGTVLVTATI